MKLAQLADKWFPDRSQELPYDATERLIERNLQEPLMRDEAAEYAPTERFTP